MKKTCFTILIFFVSVTLAQETKREREPGNLFPFSVSNDSSHTSQEATLRAAGISFPTWEEIRDSFQKFQEQLNNFRKHAARSGIIESSTTPSQFDISNGKLGRSDRRPNDESETESSSTRGFNTRSRNPPDSDYPPGYIRRPNPYGQTTSTPTLSTSELQRHTTTTIYIICICLVVMVIGSALFMCVNKCQGTGGLASNSVGSAGAQQPTSRRDRSSNSSRTPGSSSTTLSIVIPSESSSSRSSTSVGGHSSTSGSTVSIPGVKNDPKYIDDLPPPYDILFPNGKPS